MKNDISRYIRLGKNLFPICRSLTGNGNRKTLGILKKKIKNLKLIEIPSGTKVYDWTVPPEWNIKSAYVKDSENNKIIDFKNNNLHLVNYSIPINKNIKFEELKKKIFSLKKQPKFIPYVTSYYKRDWGFCISYNYLNKLKKKYSNSSKFKIEIDSSLNSKGSLTIGEAIIKGKSKKEILISTYLCHPSLCNDNLSGILLSTMLYEYFKKKNNYYSIRFVFVPEIIGSICFINKKIKELKKNFIAGYNLTCVGDERIFSFLPSKNENSLSNLAAYKIFKKKKINFKKYNYIDFRSDEGNYNSYGVGLDVATFCRSKYGDYSEYHTSADNFTVMTKRGLKTSFDVMKDIIEDIMKTIRPFSKIICEPQLGKRGLHPLLGTKGSSIKVKKYINFLQFADGKNDLEKISKIIGISLKDCKKIYQILKKKKLTN